MTRRCYPEPLVARIRAALHVGISHKAVSSYSGLSLHAVQRISCGQTQPEIRADPDFAGVLHEWLSAINAAASDAQREENHAQGSAREEMEACEKIISP